MTNRLATLIVVAFGVTPSLADTPYVQSVETVQIDGLGTFELLRDSDPNVKTLYVKPQNLVLARDAKGHPSVKVMMVRDLKANPPQDEEPVDAYGIVTLTAHLGFDNKDATLEAIRNKLVQIKSPQADWMLTTMAFRPGTGQLGVEILDRIKGGVGDVVWLPYGVTTTVGAQINVQALISREQAEIIRQSLLRGESGTNDLLVQLHYKADATFVGPEFQIETHGKADSFYSYFHEKLRKSGGFFCFTWNQTRETIREECRKNQIIATRIQLSDATLQEKVEELVVIKDLIKSWEDDAVEYMADIKVDRTGQAPPNSFEKMEGKVTIYHPFFFFDFKAWWGSSNDSVSVEQRKSADYLRKLTVSGPFTAPIAMGLAATEVGTDNFVMIDLANAGYVADLLTFQPLALPDGGRALIDQQKLQSITLEVDRGQQHYPERFDGQNMAARERMYFRDAAELLGDNGQLIWTLPDLLVSASFQTNSETVKLPPRMVKRQYGPLVPTVICASDFIGHIVVDGEQLFETLGGGQVRVEIFGLPGREAMEPQVQRLSRKAPRAVFLFARDEKPLQAKAMLTVLNDAGLELSRSQLELTRGLSDVDVMVDACRALMLDATTYYTALKDMAAPQIELQIDGLPGHDRPLQQELSRDKPFVRVIFDRSRKLDDGTITIQARPVDGIEDHPFGRRVSIKANQLKHVIVGNHLKP